MKIAFLGTGLMGAPMARHLAAQHQVTVWNRSPARAAALTDVCDVAPSPKDAAAGAVCVMSMLLDGPATADVLDDDVIRAAKDGALIIDMGSVDPATDRDIAARANNLGLDFLDAPVSGGVAGAKAASLAILVGGSSSAFERAQPIFALLGRATLLGPVGAGQIAKLANQLIVATTIGAVAEAFRLAEAGGCDAASLQSALKGGFADSHILVAHGTRMINGDFTPGGRSAAQLKDLENAMVLAEAANLSLPLAKTITEGFRDFVQVHDGAEQDHSAYYKWLALKRN